MLPVQAAGDARLYCFPSEKPDLVVEKKDFIRAAFSAENMDESEYISQLERQWKYFRKY